MPASYGDLAAAPPATASFHGGIDLVANARVAQIQKVLESNGRVFDATSGRIAGTASIPDVRAQIAARSRAAATKLKSTVDWNITTNAPVRATPATYGASWTTNSSADMIAFATDSTSNTSGLAGITTTAGIQNLASLTTAQKNRMTHSTLFVMDHLYDASGPRLIYYNNNSQTALPTNEKYGLGGLLFSLDSSDIRLYSLSDTGRLFCYQTPASPSGVATMTRCPSWGTTGFSVGTTSNVTWSSAFPTYNFATLDINRVYFGSDNGKMWCANTSSLTANASVCTGWTSGKLLNSGVKMGPPTVYEVSDTEYVIYVGDEAGKFYQIHDKAGVLTVNSYTLCGGSGSCSTPYQVHTAPLIDFNDSLVYVASGGKVFEFPLAWQTTSANWKPSHTVSLPLAGGGSWTDPIDSTPGLDYNSSVKSIYVTANSTLYKVQYPFTSSSAATSTQLYKATTAALTINATTLNPQSLPIGNPLPYYNAVFVGNGGGGTSSSSATGLVEQFGCTSSTGAPAMTEITTGGPYGVAIETALVLDWANGNLNFGYDNGNSGTASGTGGLVQYPANSTVPDTANGWSCPSPYTNSATAACGGPGCALATGCFHDTDCASSASTPYCDTATDTKQYTCVECTTDTQCTTAHGAGWICANGGTGGTAPSHTCIQTTHCTSDADCSGTDHCDLDTSSIYFDTCQQCWSGDTTNCTGSTTVCVQDVTDKNYGKCKGCDALDTTPCTSAGQVCDTTSSSTTFDSCLACSPADGTATAGNNCGSTAPICSTSVACVQCTATNTTLCPSGSCNATGKCDCFAGSACPTGTTCSSATGFGTCQ